MNADGQLDQGATLAASLGVGDGELDVNRALSLYREMFLIRELERTIENLHRLGRMSGSFHSSLGQEACAVGVCSALRAGDIVTSTHRGHGHAVAKGVPVRGIFAELRLPLADEKIHHAGQHIAVVVARTLEDAMFAAKSLKVEYDQAKHAIAMDDSAAKVVEPPQMFGESLQETRGNVQVTLLDRNLTKLEATYTTPAETHNPMEPSSTTAVSLTTDSPSIRGVAPSATRRPNSRVR